MTTQFEISKKNTVKVTVWANPTTQEIYPANRNSFGWNAERVIGDEFYKKYGFDLKHSQGKADFRKFYYSANEMRKAGFQLVQRGQSPLWGGQEVTETPEIKPAVELSQTLQAWVQSGAKHPAPASVLAEKQASGLTWNQIVNSIIFSA